MTSTHSRQSSATPCGAVIVLGSPTVPAAQSVTSQPTGAPKRPSEGRWIAAIRATAQHLASLGEIELRQASAAPRSRVSQEGPDLPGVQIEASALVCDALRRVRGVELYDEQLLAALVLAQGRRGRDADRRREDVRLCPGGLLARTDRPRRPHCHAQCLPGTTRLPVPRTGLSDAGDERRSAAGAGRQRRETRAYLCDVTYGTGYEFGFDYLRDQLSRRRTAGRASGETLWARICGGHADLGAIVQRPLYYAIVDEIDHVLLDDATSPLVLSETADEEAPDAPAHQLARRLVPHLTAGEHYRLDPSAGSVAG